jgi:hypothetical protein
MKTLFDPQQLIQQFSQASAKQGEDLRAAVAAATLQGLQGRELTLKNMRDVVKKVTSAATQGVELKNGSMADIEEMLTSAFAGMDSALLQAVEANRRALNQLVGQSSGAAQPHLQKALDDLEKFEDTLITTIEKAAASVPEPLQQAWSQVLAMSKAAGTGTGMQAHVTVEQISEQMRSAMKQSRALGMQAAQAMWNSYGALVSGVLIGMSEGLESKPPEKGTDTKTSKGRAKK